jgi:type 2 lantibiotic biosynthesis protein LanM
MREIFDGSGWYAALTLAERVVLLGGRLDAPPPPEAAERAARKVERWRQEADLLEDALFAERLATDGLTPQSFLRLLTLPVAELGRCAGGRPDWLELLARVFSGPVPPLPAGVEEGEGLSVEWLHPLIADAHTRVLAGLREIAAGAPGLGEPEGLTASLLPTLIRRLRWACERLLILELQVSRLEGRLQGETPEERYLSFVAQLRERTLAVEILQRYPVLARDACRHAGQWCESTREMMARFAADRQEIVHRFGAGRDLGPLAGVATGLSDRHSGGRSVAILTFASGLRLVYKPKPLAVDRAFQDLIAWLNERLDAGTPPLRGLEVLDRGDYGWVEHVAALPCGTPEEIERFYRRQGAWVAIFYALEANDFHHENLIAHGEHPVPIDLETLFQPGSREAAAGGPGYSPTDHTVLNSGLLPRRFWATAQERGIDLSGMGALGGETVAVGRIDRGGTDEMHWGRGELTLEAGPNVPTLRGEPVGLWDYRDAVQEGFRATYRLLAAHRGELLAPGGPLSRFDRLPVRTLVRSTGSYVHLLHVANHPDYLQDALDRDRLFDRLWLDAVVYPPFRRVTPLEHADLQQGDIPLWRALAIGTDLLHPSGGGVAEYYAVSGRDRVRARFLGMGEQDLARQGWLVQAALEATRSLDEPWSWTAMDLPDADAAGGDRFLAAARQLGDRLAQLAVEQGELVTWFHLALRPTGWLLEPMPIDLYDGLAGLALFLAHLARLAAEPSYERLARLALATVWRRLGADPEAVGRAGAFNGWGGLVYAFTHLGVLWREDALLAEAERLALQGAAGIESDRSFDIIAGTAGAVAALLALHRHRPSPGLLDAARRCGDHLLATASVDERGHGWTPSGDRGEPPLTGFSHGAAGIGWALAWLGRESGDERFRAAAEGALRYERSWFSAEHDNWPDLRRHRQRTAEVEFLHSWCHGAPGIGLGRLGTLAFLEDPDLVPEIRAAVRSTLAQGFGGSQSLCHGDLGNLELVREAGRLLGDTALASEADRLAARILARIEAGDLRCGARPKTESLGLMVGIAGIGYGLLRAAWPTRVPSVLLLETPASTGP